MVKKPSDPKDPKEFTPTQLRKKVNARIIALKQSHAALLKHNTKTAKNTEKYQRAVAKHLNVLRTYKTVMEQDPHLHGADNIRTLTQIIKGHEPIITNLKPLSEKQKISKPQTGPDLKQIEEMRDDAATRAALIKEKMHNTPDAGEREQLKIHLKMVQKAMARHASAVFDLKKSKGRKTQKITKNLLPLPKKTINLKKPKK